MQRLGPYGSSDLISKCINQKNITIAGAVAITPFLSSAFNTTRLFMGTIVGLLAPNESEKSFCKGLALAGGIATLSLTLPLEWQSYGSLAACLVGIVAARSNNIWLNNVLPHFVTAFAVSTQSHAGWGIFTGAVTGFFELYPNELKNLFETAHLLRD